MKTARPSLVVVDWGVGGRPTWRALRRRLDRDRCDVRYACDDHFAPWGTLPARVVVERLTGIAERAKADGVVGVVVACNAAGAAMAHTQTTSLAGLPCWTVVTAGQALLRDHHRQCPGTTLGVIGGRGTIRSGVYGRLLRAEGLDITQRVAQPLSALVEAGTLTGPEVEAAIAQIVWPLRGCDAVLLGCTHYPALLAPLQRALPGVTLLDPAPRLVDDVLAAAPTCTVVPALASEPRGP